MPQDHPRSRLKGFSRRAIPAAPEHGPLRLAGRAAGLLPFLAASVNAPNRSGSRPEGTHLRHFRQLPDRRGQGRFSRAAAASHSRVQRDRRPSRRGSLRAPSQARVAELHPQACRSDHQGCEEPIEFLDLLESPLRYSCQQAQKTDLSELAAMTWHQVEVRLRRPQCASTPERPNTSAHFSLSPFQPFSANDRGAGLCGGAWKSSSEFADRDHQIVLPGVRRSLETNANPRTGDHQGQGERHQPAQPRSTDCSGKWLRVAEYVPAMRLSSIFERTAALLRVQVRQSVTQPHREASRMGRCRDGAHLAPNPDGLSFLAGYSRRG